MTATLAAPPLHARLARADRLVLVVLGLQSHVVVLAEEALHGRLLAHERDDDLAVRRRVLPADDDVVAGQDPRVLHRVAAYAQDVLALLAARERRHLDVVLDVLLGEHGRAGGDLADERDALADDALHALHGRLDDRADVALHAIEQLDRPRLGRVAA